MNVVITGGARGIGAALAHRMAARGARVVIAARTETELANTRDAIARAHGSDRCLAARCDVADASSVDALRAAATAFFGGAAQVVVNNAGIVERAPLHQTSEALYDRVMGVNVRGAYLVSRAFLPTMLQRGAGRVLFVSSISATLGTANASAYNASKWAMVGLMKSLAEELRPAGLQSMAVLPGSVDTQMLVGSGFAPQMSADDVAKTLEWLAYDAPDAMTGSAVECFG